MSKHWRH